MEKLFTMMVCLVLPGLFLILYTLRLITGQGDKSFYMTNHIYSGRVYGSIPWGIGFLVLATASIPKSPDVSLIFVGVAIGFGILGLIFAFIQPSFLKPAWFKWLEREHGDILPLLIQDANQVGLKAWNDAIKTQEDMEIWVAEVRRKYGV